MEQLECRHSWDMTLVDTHKSVNFNNVLGVNWRPVNLFTKSIVPFRYCCAVPRGR